MAKVASTRFRSEPSQLEKSASGGKMVNGQAVKDEKVAEAKNRKAEFTDAPKLQEETEGPKKSNLGVLRILRRRKLTQQPHIERQISRGRPDTKKTWCGQKHCLSEKLIFDLPVGCFMDRRLSKIELPVIDYHKRFVVAVVEHTFPDLTDFAAKTAKLRAIWSFVDSPPIRASFWRCKRLCLDNELRTSSENLKVALMDVQPIFQDAMFGAKTSERVDFVHKHLDVDDEAPRDLKFALLQFLFRAELFRRHETCHSTAWAMEDPEQVGRFLTALTFNYWKMDWDCCFREQNMLFDQEWDRTWDEWLAKFPMHSCQLSGGGKEMVVREEHEGSEEDVLKNIGYLGGVGTWEGSYRPTRK